MTGQGPQRGRSRWWLASGVVVAIVVLSAIGRAPDAGGPAAASVGAASPTSAATTPATSTSAAPSPVPGQTSGLAPTGPIERATVVRVVDGDTIVIDRGRGEERLRYIGVDTPETVDPRQPVQWMGPEASAANKALVDGRAVVLERDVSETDRFGRLLRYVWLEDGASVGAASGWLLVNLELVARGFAQVSTFPPDVRYVELYLAAQRIAREQGLGLWGEGPERTAGPGGDCDAAYPTVCIPPPPPDLDCGDIAYRRFEVLPPDPHRFDGDGDGVGCES